MWDPPASITSSPHTAHTGTIDMQGTIQLLGSSPPAAVLGSARLVLGAPTTAQHKSQTNFSDLEKLTQRFSPCDSFSLIQIIYL